MKLIITHLPKNFFFTKGIIQRLGHIANLGAGVLWLSPIFKSPMADAGYDITDFRDVDPMFGTLQDFDELVSAAKEKGKNFTP